MRSPPSTSPAANKKRDVLHKNGISDYGELINRLVVKNDENFRRMLEKSRLPSCYHDDVISDVWTVAFSKIDTVQYNFDENPITSASNWLYGVFNNKLCDKWRAFKREQKAKEQATEEMDKAAQEESASTEEIRDILKEALQNLKPKHRELIKAVHLERIQYKELQERFDGTVNQLKSCCYYARKKWREEVIKLAKRELIRTPESNVAKIEALRSLIYRLELD